MKKSIKYLLAIAFIGMSFITYAQEGRNLQFFRPAGQDGLNIFESPKADTVEFTGVKVRIGGDFAIQFQGIDQENSIASDTLVELGDNFNLPTANLDLDVQLYDGVRMHLRTYLSARHHEESWVKGGYLQVDKLDFIKPGFLEGLMEVATIRVGLDEFNYGDAHFRRTDNARAIYNPFVGNYLMDAFSTEVFGEVTIQKSGFIGVIGLTNGKLNQSTVVNDNTDNKASFFGKLGYDNNVSDDLRLRLTGSWYINKGETSGTYLYGGDRGGSRYYNVMTTIDGDGNDFEGRFNPRFKQITAIQINPFVKFKGLEFFGIYEVASNSDDQGSGSFTQVAGEVIYRFGGQEQLYVGGRYNTVSGEMVDGAPTMEVNRLNIGGGWFLTKNIVTKLEYVSQKYEGDGWNGTKYQGGEFNGVMIEAAISF
ncbi:hypothetical protein GCM10009122_55280 [Fulvivirga kasyanovii]|uniref:Porin n=1 Tax=Fulvivirga kasyanovii TaxID=396812 RepID=A0ABW9RI84_9BACT|nr:hypothetical protein [Fulvivirga kasyanovii]MTI23635.1 hypothetical protein [Fulvivirga kasyanovii]